MHVAMISDIKGYDDEGMKKIARKLTIELNKEENMCVRLLDLKSAFANIKNFDVVHFIGGPSFKTLLAIFLLRLVNRNIKTVLTFSNPFWSKFSDILFNIVRPECSIVLSEKWYKKLLDKNTKVALLCLSGVDVNQFCPASNEEKSRYKKELKFPENKNIILHVGHIKEDRNISILKKLQSEYVQVVLVGSTTTKKSIELKSELVDSGVIVVDKYVKNIEKYYQASDCYLFPTVAERGAVQIPLSILEALATNTPVLTTDFGGLKEFIGNCKGVKFIDSFELFNLNNSISQLIESRESSKGCIKEYTWPIISTQVRNLYKQLFPEKATS